MKKGVRTDGVKLRVNRGLIVLNDLDSGNVWDITDKPVKIDNWDSVIPPPQTGGQEPEEGREPVRTTRSSTHAAARRSRTSCSVRPGRTSTLHVLDNDSDSQGSILGIAPGDVSKPGRRRRQRRACPWTARPSR